MRHVLVTYTFGFGHSGLFTGSARHSTDPGIDGTSQEAAAACSSAPGGCTLSHGRPKCASSPSTTKHTMTGMSGSSITRTRRFAMVFKMVLVVRRTRTASTAPRTTPKYTSAAFAASPAMAGTSAGSFRRAARATAEARQMEARDQARVANPKQKQIIGTSGASVLGDMPFKGISIMPLRHLGRLVARMTLITIGFQCYPA